MRNLLILLFLMCVVLSTKGQTLLEHGIIDTDGSPVPFAHVRIEGSTKGTVANRRGQFQLLVPEQVSGGSIMISAVGYQTQILQMGSIPDRITLQPDVIQLQEVVIVPRDYALELVQKAISKIPENYPNTREKLTGFLRESTYWQKEGPKAPLYVAESVIEAIKEGYDKKHDKGIIKLIEGRNYQSDGLQALDTRIYAGAHHPHRFDAVMKREELLNRPEKFEFELTDTLRNQGKDLFVVAFNGEGKRPSGEIYIEDESFAITEISFTYDHYTVADDQRIMLDYQVTYRQDDDQKWRLARTYYFTTFNKQQKELVLTSEFISTDHAPEPADIPYIERVHFSDYLLYETQTYNPDFWADYDILLGDPEVEALFANTIDPESQNNQQDSKTSPLEQSEPPLLRILRRFSADYGISHAPLKIQPYQLSFSNNALSIDENQTGRTLHSVSFTVGLRYRLFDRLHLGYRTELPLTRGQVQHVNIALLYPINVTPQQRPIYVTPMVGLSFTQLRYRLGKYETDESFTIRGREFDSNKTLVSFQDRQTRAMAGISIGVELAGKFQLYTAFHYYHAFSSTQGLFFEERSEAFDPKRRFLKNGAENLNITRESPLENFYSVAFGVIQSF